LKLADKTLVVGFIPLLFVMFLVFPYIEVGKSRRYADRRVGLTVAFLFMAFMFLSNWMGSPEYLVQSSPEQEVSQSILPQEGPSVLLGVPYEDLTVGTWFPGQIVDNNPHLTEALHAFEEAMIERSCTLTGNTLYDECQPLYDDTTGEIVGYRNNFASQAMVDPTAKLTIEQAQHNMVKLIVSYEAEDPFHPGVLIIGKSSDRIAFRHEDSNYEEECRFINKNC
jgi:hypothetical protein